MKEKLWRKNMLFLFILCFTTFLSIGQQFTQIGSTIDGEEANLFLGFNGQVIMAIGSPGFDNGGPVSDNFGNVRIFQFDGTDWAQLGNSIIGTQGSSAGFFANLNGAGNRVAVTFFTEDNSDDVTQAGVVRVFEFDGTDWIQLGDAIEGTEFLGGLGRGISLNDAGDRLALIELECDCPGNDIGRSVVFEFDGTDWVQLANQIELFFDGAAGNTLAAMNAAGDVYAVGSIFGSLAAGEFDGYADVYEFDGSSWVQKGQRILGLDNPNSQSGLFGRGLDINDEGNIIIVGDNRAENDEGVQTGHARVLKFEESTNLWEPLGQIINGDNLDDSAGLSVSINGIGDRIVVGIPENNVNNNGGLARVFQFDETASEWVLIGETITGEQGADRFGTAVELNQSGSIIAGSSRFSDGVNNGLENAGTVRVFELSDAVPPSIVTPNDLEACDELGDGIETFDLTSQIPTILDGIDPATVDLSFHVTQSDAEVNQNAIATPEAHMNASNPQTIFVRVQFSDQPTLFSIVTFDLILLDVIDITTNLPESVELCTSSPISALDATPTNPDIDVSLVTYSWVDQDGNIVSTDPTFTPTNAGTLTITIDFPPCSQAIFTVEVLMTPPIVNLGDDTSICQGDSFEIVPTVTGDIEGATFLWTTGETTPTIVVDEAGTFGLTITIGSCTASDEIVISIAQPPTVDLGPDELICEGGSFEIIPTLTGDVDGATFLWTTGETTPTIIVDEAGTFELTVTAGNCTVTASDEIVITVATPPIVDLGIDELICDGESFEIIPVLEGNLENATFLWSTGDTTESIIVNQSGTFTLTVTVGPCSISNDIVVTIADQVIVTTREDFTTCREFEETFVATTDTPGATFEWFIEGITQGETSNTFTTSFPLGTASGQEVTVVVTNASGCTGEATTIVSFFEIDQCLIPEGISPGTTIGFNDRLDLEFLAVRTGIETIHIYNRLGTLIFEQDNYVDQWEGQSDNGHVLPTATYFYVIDFDGNDPVYGNQVTGSIYVNREN